MATITRSTRDTHESHPPRFAVGMKLDKIKVLQCDQTGRRIRGTHAPELGYDWLLGYLVSTYKMVAVGSEFEVGRIYGWTGEIRINLGGER